MPHCEMNTNPIDKVVLECPLDKLMEGVRGNQFIDVGVREAHCKRLESSVSIGSQWTRYTAILSHQV